MDPVQRSASSSGLIVSGILVIWFIGFAQSFGVRGHTHLGICHPKPQTPNPRGPPKSLSACAVCRAPAQDAYPNAIHNFSHDVRHIFAFPCH